MTDDGSIYNIEIMLDTPLCHPGTDIPWAESNGLVHQVIELSEDGPYPRALTKETAEAWRWAAGIISRIVLTLASEMTDVAKVHGCSGAHARGLEECGRVGISLCNSILDPLTAWADVENGLMYAYLSVPGEGDEPARWHARAQELLRQAIASDLRPVVEPTPTSPADDHDGDHGASPPPGPSYQPSTQEEQAHER